MTVKRVVNQSGPQSVNNCQDAVSQHTLQTATERSASHTAEFPLPTGINERLSSMETHVKLSPGKYSFSMFTKFCECFLLSWWGVGMVICLQRGADLHMFQLMPLPLTVSCFSKIQIGFAFLVPAHLGSPRKRAVKRVCVCVPIVMAWSSSGSITIC